MGSVTQQETLTNEKVRRTRESRQEKVEERTDTDSLSGPRSCVDQNLNERMRLRVHPPSCSTDESMSMEGYH